MGNTSFYTSGVVLTSGSTTSGVQTVAQSAGTGSKAATSFYADGPGGSIVSGGTSSPFSTVVNAAVAAENAASAYAASASAAATSAASTLGTVAFDVTLANAAANTAASASQAAGSAAVSATTEANLASAYYTSLTSFGAVRYDVSQGLTQGQQNQAQQNIFGGFVVASGGVISAARLPTPTTSTLGGVEATVSAAHNFLTYVDTGGVVHSAQPAFTDLSGNISVGQMNTGTSAATSTFWRGDGTWAVPGTAAVTNGGFVNVLRNATLTSWFHGSAGTITTAGNWSAEGIYLLPTGSSVVYARTSGTGPTEWNMVVSGGSGVTDLKARLPIESQLAARLAGQVCTFQMPIANNTGATVSATLTLKYASATDVWTSAITDVGPVNLQTVANGGNAVLAYNFSASANAIKGYEAIVDFGNNFGSSTKTITMSGGFNLSVASAGAIVGQNNSPPTPELRDAAAENAFNERYFRSTYDNGLAAGSNASGGMVGNFGGDFDINWEPQMWAAPTITWYDHTGAQNRMTSIGSNAGGPTYTSGSTATVGSAGALGAISTRGFLFVPGNATGTLLVLHYAADTGLIGG